MASPDHMINGYGYPMQTIAAHGAKSCLSVRTQPLTATGAPSQTSTIPCHTIQFSACAFIGGCSCAPVVVHDHLMMSQDVIDKTAGMVWFKSWVDNEQNMGRCPGGLRGQTRLSHMSSGSYRRGMVRGWSARHSHGWRHGPLSDRARDAMNGLCPCVCVDMT